MWGVCAHSQGLASAPRGTHEGDDDDNSHSQDDRSRALTAQAERSSARSRPSTQPCHMPHLSEEETEARSQLSEGRSLTSAGLYCTSLSLGRLPGPPAGSVSSHAQSVGGCAGHTQQACADVRGLGDVSSAGSPGRGLGTRHTPGPELGSSCGAAACGPGWEDRTSSQPGGGWERGSALGSGAQGSSGKGERPLRRAGRHACLSWSVRMRLGSGAKGLLAGLFWLRGPHWPGLLRGVGLPTPTRS